MNAPLDIGRLSTRIRSSEPARAQALAGQLRQVAGPGLARALDGSGERALARAGLPASARVAVQRLDLALRVSADVDERQLAEGWAAAFEATLAGLLARSPAGDDDASVVWFADAWAAEGRHLARRAAGLPDAWWAQDLAGDGQPDARGTEASLGALAILLRWLARDPPRAVATIAALARADARVITLLEPDAARTLTRHLLGLFSHPAGPAPASAPAEGEPGKAATAGRQPEQALLRLTELRNTLLAALHAGAGAGADLHGGSGAPIQAVPWLVATLFTLHPALSRLPAAEIEQLLARWLQRALPRRPAAAGTATGPRTAQPNGPDATPTPPVTDTVTDTFAHHETRAGGLLLLLAPLARLGLLPPPEHLAQGLGDLALTALRRVLASLPSAERAVAQERERPLLAVFAPECDWGERIATLPVREPEAAEALLDALIAAIPADIAFAPSAQRRIFGSAQPAFATAAARRLACLVLRPGVLTVSAWDAELAWPLASVDLALRRAGWDQDPGWLPWLGRSLRWRFGDAS